MKGNSSTAVYTTAGQRSRRNGQRWQRSPIFIGKSRLACASWKSRTTCSGESRSEGAGSTSTTAFGRRTSCQARGGERKSDLARPPPCLRRAPAERALAEDIGQMQRLRIGVRDRGAGKQLVYLRPQFRGRDAVGLAQIGRA